MPKRAPSCLCDVCPKCKNRLRAARRYAEKKEHISAVRKAWYVLNAEKARAYAKAYRAAHKEALLAADKLRPRPAVDPFKKQARTAVSNAVRLGKMQKQPCEVCGSFESQAHHDDYSKPLEVRWLCIDHHMLLHRRVAA